MFLLVIRHRYPGSTSLLLSVIIIEVLSDGIRRDCKLYVVFLEVDLEGRGKKDRYTSNRRMNCLFGIRDTGNR